MRKLWGVASDTGGLKSTSFRIYKPDVRRLEGDGSLCVYDHGGFDDVLFEDYGEDFLTMSLASKFVIMMFNATKLGKQDRTLVRLMRDKLGIGVTDIWTSMVILVNRVDMVDDEVLANLDEFKVRA